MLCQGAEINLDIHADPDQRLTYEDLRLRVVNGPASHCVVVELLLRLFLLHILGASPDYVAQPEGVTLEHRVWTSDGVAWCSSISEVSRLFCGIRSCQR